MESNKIKSSWSHLPSELVIAIAGNLTEFTDHLRFRAVCSHWRSSFHSPSLRLPPQLPWLALPSTSSTHLYSLSEDRIYSYPPPSVGNNSNLLGSASGWFLSVSGRNHHITFSLISPFTGAAIGLPSPNPCCSLSYGAADTLIWDRCDSVVMAACSTKPGVFYCRLGEAAWTSMEYQKCCMASSIIFYEGRFYILEVDTWETVVLDGETLEQITVMDAPCSNHPVWANKFVSSGELLLLLQPFRMYDCPDNEPQFYEVYRVNFNDKLVEWIEVDDIGDRALFVDNLHCFSVKVGDNSLLRRNCIYTASAQSILAQLETSGGPRSSLMKYSISIFDMGNSSWEHLEGALSKFLAASSCAASSRASSSLDAVSPPSWIMPSLG